MRISLNNIFMLCRHPRLCYLLECLSAQTSFSIRNSRILNTEWVDWNTLKRSHRRGAEVAEVKIFFPNRETTIGKKQSVTISHLSCFFLSFPRAYCSVPSALLFLERLPAANVFSIRFSGFKFCCLANAMPWYYYPDMDHHKRIPAPCAGKRGSCS